MSYYKDRFRDHTVHVTISGCLTAIQSHELDNISDEEVIAITRCEHVVEFTKTMLDRCDTDLVSQTVLDQLNSAVTALLNHWNAFVQNRDWNVLTVHGDSLLTHVANLSSKQRPIPKTYTHLLSSLRDRTAEMLRQIREASQQQDVEIEDFDSRLEVLSKSIEQQESQLEAQKTRMDTLITQQLETFGNAQQTRGQEFTSFIDDRESDFDNAQSEQESKFEELYQQVTQAGQEQIDNLKADCEHAKEIVGIIGNVGVTGEYQKVANQEKNMANIFRWFAMACFIGMLVTMFFILQESFKTESCDWTMVLFRVLFATIILVPALYCARESTKHRKREQENRKLELELASISPFLEKLNDPAAAKEILKKLAPEYFGNHPVDESGTPLVNIDSKSVEAALKPVVELIKILK